MTDQVAAHYSGSGGLAEAIAESLRSAGKNLDEFDTADLQTIDEYHVRGREATLELAERMMLSEGDRVLDIGSGLGGPARTLAAAYGCHVTGVDLTQEFCDSAGILSGWVGLGQRTAFQRGDATNLPFGDEEFDAAMTIHAAMNIAAKDKLYEEARRVVKPGRIFAVYDILQGEGGDAVFPVPWADQSSISYLVTPEEMESLLASAGFEILDAHDSTHEGRMWYEAMVERMERAGPPDLNFQAFVGADFPEMARNQVRNLTERRIRTVSYICRA